MIFLFFGFGNCRGILFFSSSRVLSTEQSTGVAMFAPEIVGEVLNHLNPDLKEDHDALIICGSVDRCFRETSRRVLYASVTLYLGCPKTFRQRQPPVYTSFSGFYEMVKQMPDIANYVRNLALIFHPFRAVWDDARDFDKLIETLTRLQKLTLSGLHEEAAPTKFMNALNNSIRSYSITPTTGGPIPTSPLSENSPDEYATALKEWRHYIQKAFFMTMDERPLSFDAKVCFWLKLVRTCIEYSSTHAGYALLFYKTRSF
jgi:hypothetical protein